MRREEDEERFHCYELSGLLEKGFHFYIDTETQIAILMDGNTEPAQLSETQVFTDAEVDLVYVLLDNSPHYASYIDLYAAFQRITLPRARKVLSDADETRTWDSVMRPVRNVISRVRVKLRNFGLDVTSLHETGYILIALQHRT